MHQDPGEYGDDVPDQAHYHSQNSDSAVDNLTKLINADLHLMSTSTVDGSFQAAISELIRQIHDISTKLRELGPRYPVELGKSGFEITEYWKAFSHIRDGIDMLLDHLHSRHELGSQTELIIRELHLQISTTQSKFNNKFQDLTPGNRSLPSSSSGPPLTDETNEAVHWYEPLTDGMNEVFREITEARTKLVGPQPAAAAAEWSEDLKSGFDRLLSLIERRRTAFQNFRDYNESSYACGSSEAHLNLERDLRQLGHKVSILKSVFPFSILGSDWQKSLDDSSIHHPVPDDDDTYSWLQKVNRHIRFTSDEELKASFRKLNQRSKICLMCFLVFPEDAFIKKSLLDCWSKAHDIGLPTEPIEHLINNGFIQPVFKKETSTAAGFWMHPFVHTHLANQKWLQPQASHVRQRLYVPDSTHDDEDIIYADPAQILARKELRILHLGNWQRLSSRHIEVEHPDSFFKHMAKLSELRYVSLRDISRVTELPKFITKLEKLEILDLKSCHYLEVLPPDIGNLRCSLTHLDMSDCYLDEMPISLSKLHNLRVLKGFFVSQANKKNSCTLQDLLDLVNLKKLNIYTSKKSFPDGNELSILKCFKFLHSLTISWGRCSVPRGAGKYEDNGRKEEKPTRLTSAAGWFRKKNKKESRPSSSGGNDMISFNLEKLDLQCVPGTVTGRDWLKPSNFKHLKKLYIRGGRFCDLGCLEGEEEDYQWKNVEILRLKHLENLRMDYVELKKLFPNIKIVDSVG